MRWIELHSVEIANLFIWVHTPLIGICIITFIVGLIYWKKIGEAMSGTWAKFIVEGIQIFAGVCSVCATYGIATNKEIWLNPVLFGMIDLGVWKLFQIYLDERIKRSDSIQKKVLEAYERQSEDIGRLIGVLRAAVKRKIERIRKVIQNPKSSSKISHVRTALTPHPHLDDLLAGIATYFRGQLSKTKEKNVNFRVGVYVARDKVMSPIHGISERDPGFNPFTSFETHKERFHFDSDKPAFAVQSAVSKKMIIVESCEKESKDEKFYFFNSLQANYLRSMVSYYLGKVCLPDGTMTDASLVIDTDLAGFFKLADSQEIEYCLHEFGTRIKLEFLLHALLEKGGISNGKRNRKID